jgi:hypothetical protein
MIGMVRGTNATCSTFSAGPLATMDALEEESENSSKLILK